MKEREVQNPERIHSVHVARIADVDEARCNAGGEHHADDNEEGGDVEGLLVEQVGEARQLPRDRLYNLLLCSLSLAASGPALRHPQSARESKTNILVVIPLVVVVDNMDFC